MVDEPTEDELIIKVPIYISRELYRMWEGFFLGYRDEKTENELFEQQKKEGEISARGLLGGDIQECFEVGLRVFSALSPVFREMRKEFDEELEGCHKLIMALRKSSDPKAG